MLLLAVSARADATPPGTTAPARSASFLQELHDRPPQDLLQRGVLRLATDGTYPPASVFDADGRTIVGVQPDLGAALGRVLGDRRPVRPDGLRRHPAADVQRTRRRRDGAMTDTQERQAGADFVDYFSAGTSIVVAARQPARGAQGPTAAAGRPARCAGSDDPAGGYADVLERWGVSSGAVTEPGLDAGAAGCPRRDPAVRAGTTAQGPRDLMDPRTLQRQSHG